MKKINWDEKMSMGSDVIDGHHQKLIHCINLLDNAIGKGPVDKVFLHGVVLQLLDYTNYHFKTEEEYMEKYGYPEFKAHREEHGDFIAEVEKFKTLIETSNLQNLDNRMVSYLKTWLIQHILIIDKEYSIYFAAKGIQVP